VQYGGAKHLIDCSSHVQTHHAAFMCSTDAAPSGGLAVADPRKREKEPILRNCTSLREVQTAMREQAEAMLGPRDPPEEG
jgi:hypothetical protein